MKTERPRPRGFSGPAEFRAWLEANGTSAPELYVRCVKRGSGRGGLTYRQALDEALCLGWIDGVRHAVDADSFSVRFSPRKPKSAWSTVNIRRFGELQSEGRVAPTGLAAFEARVKSEYSFESRPRALGRDELRAFRAKAEAWRFFSAQPPGYRRLCCFWIMSAKRPETRERRLALLIFHSGRGRRLPPLARPEARRERKRDGPR